MLFFVGLLKLQTEEFEFLLDVSVEGFSKFELDEEIHFENAK